MDRRLSALVVNYNSGAFAVRCVESLLREWSRERRPRELLEIVLIDNASPEDQSAHLERIEELGAKVLRSEKNLGYSAGLNRCFLESGGRPEDAIAILNPDIFFLPGSVGTLLDYVTDNADVGAADPRACVDPLGRMHLPRNFLPTPLERMRLVLAQMSPHFARRYSRRRVERCIEWWTAQAPLESDMLSGCCLFLRRGVAEELAREQGLLMDERFTLYFEDTDLFRRLKAKGYRLIHHGGARILHHWARSTGLAGGVDDETQRRYIYAQDEYFRKYYGRAGLAFLGAVHYFEQHVWPKRLRSRPMHPFVSVGSSGEEPVEIRLPRPARYLLEGALEPSWTITIGIFGEGDRWVLPRETWEWLFEADYFVRAIDLDTREVLGAWHYRKTAPGRSTPLRDAEIEGHGEALFGGKAG